MSSTLEKSRGSVMTGKTQVSKKSEKVDRLLIARGRNGSTSGQPPKVKPRKLPKGQADGQFKEFGGRCAVALEAIAADLKVLEMIPGMAGTIEAWQEKQAKAIAPQSLGKWKDSLDLLDQLQKDLHEEVRSTRDKMATTLKDSGKQRKTYETLCGELTALSDQLALYPATAPSLSAIETAFKTARDFYGQDDFANAVRTLEEAKADATTMLDTLNKLDKAARGSDRLKPLYKRLGEFDTKIGEAEVVLGKSAIAAYRGQSAELYDVVLKAADESKSKKAMSTAKDDAVRIVSGRLDIAEPELIGKAETATRLRKSVNDQVDRLRQDIAVFGELQPTSTVEVAYKALAGIGNALGAFQYEAADTSSKKLRQTVDGWKNGATDSPAAMAKYALEAFKVPAEREKTRAQKLEAAIPEAPILATPPTVASVIEMLQTQLDSYDGARNTFPLSQGLETLKIAIDLNSINEERKKNYLALAKAEPPETSTLYTHSSEITALADQVRKSIDAMIVAIAKSGTTVKTLPSYETPLQTILADWNDAKTTAQTEKDLRFDEFAKRLKALKQQVDDDIANPVKVTDKAVEGQFADLAVAFKAAAKTTDEAVEALIDVDYDTGDMQRSLADSAVDAFDQALKAHDPTAAQKAVDAIRKIAADATTAADTAKAALSRTMLAFNVAVRDIGDAIGTLVQRTKSGKLKDYAGIAATFRSECDQLAATGQSTDASIITASLDKLYALRGKANDLKALLDKIENGTVDKKKDVTFDTLNDRAAKAKKTYNDDTVSKFEAGKLKDLTDRLATVTGAIGTVPLADSSKALADLDAEWLELKQTAEQHKKDVERFATTIDDLKKQFDQKGELRQFWTEFSDYKKALIAKLDGLRTTAKSDGTMDHAALDGIRADIIKATTQPGAAARGNAQAQTVELEEQMAEKAWTATYASFQGTVKGLRAILKTLDESAATNFKQKIEELESSAAVVKKSEGKTPYATMIDQIKALASNANKMQRFPMGQATAARGEIMLADKAWNEAVEQFRDKVSGLPGAIETAMKGDPKAPEVKKAIEDKVTKARDLIQPGSITAMAQKMIAAKDDISTARDAREEAMREVKRLQRLVLGAPQFMALASNPFKVDVTSELGNLNATLFSLETVLAISL